MATDRPLTAERAVVVFAPGECGSNHFRLDVWVLGRNNDRRDWAVERFRMFKALTTLCRSTTGTITLFNTSCFDRQWLDCPPNTSTSDHFESQLRKSIDSAMATHPVAEPKSVQGRLEFMGIKEYLGSCHWAKEFTREEVRWL